MSKQPAILPLPTELTMSTIDQVRAQVLPLVSTPNARVILDLSPTDIVTTPGIGLLLELHRLARQSQGQLVLASAQPRFLDVIQRTQLDRVLILTPTLADAQARFN